MEPHDNTAQIKQFPDRQIAKKTLYRVIIGIWITAAVVILVGIWFVPNVWACLAGELLGSGIATALMFHLYHCIDVELDIGEVKAGAHSRWNAMIRLAVEIAAIAGCCFIPNYIHPVAMLVGLFGRKIGALMVPIIFDKERNGQMTEEDRKQLREYGRLLSKKEMKEKVEAIAGKFNFKKINTTAPLSLDSSSRALLQIGCALIVEPRVIVLNNVLCFLNRDDLALVLAAFSEFIKNGGCILNFTSDIEESLFGSRIIVLGSDKILIEGETLGVLNEEKIMKRLGIGLPFVISLSKYLKDYELIDRYYLDYKSLGGALWK